MKKLLMFAMCAAIVGAIASITMADGVDPGSDPYALPDPNWNGSVGGETNASWYYVFSYGYPGAPGLNPQKITELRYTLTWSAGAQSLEGQGDLNLSLGQAIMANRVTTPKTLGAAAFGWAETDSPTQIDLSGPEVSLYSNSPAGQPNQFDIYLANFNAAPSGPAFFITIEAWDGTTNLFQGWDSANALGLYYDGNPNDNSNGFTNGLKLTTQIIPEPLTMLGLFAGIGGVGAYIRKRKMAA